jgi:surface polysaccharide O-acyltransferase-like enzyme
LRGLACVLLVAFHAIGWHFSTGLHVADDSGYRFFANLFQYVRMPLFTFLSGFVYAYRPVLSGGDAEFARRKFVRLVLPLLCVSTLYYAAAKVGPAGNTEGMIPLDQMWRIYVFSYVHYWFLQAIIVIFAVVAMLDRWQLLATPGRYAVALLASVAIHLTINMQNADDVPFSALDALYLAPFFLLGLGANRFRSVFLQPRVSWTCVFVLLLTMSLHALILLQGGWPDSNGTLLELMIGATGTIAMIGLFPKARLLERIGAYSFAIYLFHPFFVAAVRGVSKPIGITWLIFTACLIAGVAGPMVLERVLGHVPIVKTLLFGLRTRQKESSVTGENRAGAVAGHQAQEPG